MAYRVRLNLEELELLVAGLMCLRNQAMRRGWLYYKIDVDLGKSRLEGTSVLDHDITAIDWLIKRLRRVPAVSRSLRIPRSERGRKP